MPHTWEELGIDTRGLPQSYTAAKVADSQHYFTGKPCKYGHVDIRYTVNRKCAACARTECSAYHNRHLQQERLRKNQWAKENPEKNLAQSLLWAKDNPDKIIEIRRQTYVKYGEKRRASSLQWAKDNPTKKRAQYAKRRARKKNAEGSHTGEDILEIYVLQSGRCYWCQKDVGSTYHVDHVIPLAQGGSNRRENLVISCPTCNLRKRDKTPAAFIGRLF